MGEFHHILSLSQFSPHSLTKLFNYTNKLIQRLDKREPTGALAGKIIALLFFEPSSRTFSSFSSAVKRLGGQTIEYQNMMETSSTVKGESLEDTIYTIQSYSDAIVMRHPETGSAARAAAVSSVPIINAGDGAGEHPTQTLLDLFTLHQRFGRLDNLVSVMGIDPLHSRTIRSLALGMSLFPNNTIYFLSPKHLAMAPEILKKIKKNGARVVEIHDAKDIPANSNFWYWNRIQKERFTNEKDYEKAKGAFTITRKLLKERGNKDMIIMDPLPRVGEIEVAVDSDPRAVYITKQMRNGLYIRMALLSLILGKTVRR